MPEKLKIIQDIALLYELSLAAGNSLNIKENCQQFLRVLNARKSLTYSAIWLRRDAMDGHATYVLEYGTPSFRIRDQEMTTDHPVAQKLEEQLHWSVSEEDPLFQSCIQEHSIAGGAYAILRLRNVGFLKMYALNRANPFTDLELRQLRAVTDKFAVTLEGCISYEKLRFETVARREAQNYAERSKFRLQQIIDSAMDGVVTIDEEGRVVAWNKMAEHIFGYSAVEVMGEELSELIVPEAFREAHNRGMKHFLATGEGPVLNKRIEIVALNRAGKVFPVELSIAPLKFDDGYHFNAFIRDISRRKADEEQVERTQIRLKSLIQNMQAGILLEDENRTVVLTNQYFCDLFQIPAEPQQMIGMDCTNAAETSKGLFAEPGVFVEEVNMALAERKLRVNEPMAMADGRQLERDYIPLVSDGRYLGHLWLYRDVTERYRSQEALRRSEEKYRGILENLDLGLMEVNAQNVIVRAYDRFCEMTGYTEEEIIGRDADEVFVHDQESRSIIDRQNARRKEGKPGVYEMQIRRKDGNIIWVLVGGAPIFDEKDQVIGSIGVHYDVTQQKEIAEKLAQAKQTADEARQAADQARIAERQFLANMSHEIRTPMNAVIGMTHLLYDTKIDERQKEYLDALRFSADSLLGLINNILDLSKIEAGELTFEQREFDLAKIMKNLRQTFQFKLREKPVSVIMDFDLAIENRVISDPTRLTQILTNLLGNASKFTDRGTIGIHAKLLRGDTQAYWIEFRVTDTGIGIPPNKLDSIFQNFKQADLQITRKYGGTGLGLSIVKQIVELQGGSIRVESQPGMGSSFIVEMPMANSGVKALEEDDLPIINEDDLNGMVEDLTFLVAEDNTMNQKLISRILENWGAEYHIAADGQKALHATKEKRYDVVLMDIHMPIMDGCETAEAIRADADNPNHQTPIIALTAAALLEEKNRALASGMQDFLTKPFSPDNLRDVVLKYVSEQAEGISIAPPSVSASGQEGEVEIDLTYLYEFSGNDKLFVQDMLDTFIKESPIAMEQLREHQAANDRQKMYRIVHSMKPNLMMLGMKPQEENALSLEKLLKAESSDEQEVQARLQQLGKDVAEAIPKLRTLLRNLNEKEIA